MSLVGFPGGGKSMWTGKMALEDLEAGRPIACNKRMVGAEHIPNFDDMMSFAAENTNATIYVEEAGVFMRKREVPEEILDLAAQARHRGIDLILNYQAMIQVDPEILRLCQVIIKCEKLFMGLPGYDKGLSDPRCPQWLRRIFGDEGFVLNPIHHFLWFEAGESKPFYGAMFLINWVLWRPWWQNRMARALVGKSQHRGKDLAAQLKRLERAHSSEE